MTNVIDIKQVSSQAAPLDPSQITTETPSPVHYKLGKPTRVFLYRDALGDVIMQVCRFESGEDGEKQKEIRPYSKLNGCWKWAFIPKDRPLFNLDKLSTNSKSAVIVTEGEKAAEAMSVLLPDATVTTTSGGSKAPNKTNFIPLKNRDVLIIPDADKPGEKYAHEIAKLAHKSGARSVQIMDTTLWARTKIGADGALNYLSLPEHKKGWDPADALSENWDADKYAALVKDHGHQLIKPNYPKHWPFRIDGNEVAQIGWAKLDGQNIATYTPVFSRLDIVGRLTDKDSAAHGVLVELEDDFGKSHQLKISMADIHGAKINDVTAMLAEHGWKTISQNAAGALRAYLQHHPINDHIHVITKTGWQDDTKFATPCWASGCEEPTFFDCDADHNQLFASNGSHSDWKTNLGNFGASQPDLAFTLSLALSGPLLQIFDRDGFGVHFFGASSCGKSTLLRAAASVWGPSNQQVKTWNLTTTALEATTTLSNHTLLCLDELGQAEPHAAFEAGYTIANGLGKGRGTVTGGARKRSSWLVPFLSNGEIPFAQYAQSRGGSGAMAGQKTRIIDVPADAGAGFGVLTSIPDQFLGPAELINALNNSAKNYYGTAGRQFVDKLLEDKVASEVDLKSFIGFFNSTVEPLIKDADPQISRVAKHLSLVAAAGEFAAKNKVVDWPSGTATDAVAAILLRWIDHRGGTGADEETQAKEAVNEFLLRHGDARFTDKDLPMTEGYGKVHNQAGYKYRDSNSNWIYLIFIEVFKNEVCAGKDPKLVCRALVKSGQLKQDSAGKNAVPVRLPGHGTKRVYSVRLKEVNPPD